MWAPSLRYNDALPWPAEADGGGQSLTLVDPTFSPDDPANWRASFEPGGSPGRLESTGFTGDPDGDDNGNGISNLVEFAIGTNLIEFAEGANGTVLLSLTRNSNSAQVSLQIADHPEAGGWETMTAPPVSRTTHPDGTETLVYSIQGRDRLFARVLVQLR